MCESNDTYASYPPKLLSRRQPAKELQRNLILIPSTFNHFSIYLASTPKCAVVQMYRFYRMYRKSDINICVKKTATIQKVVCFINLQKQESVSVGHILTVTKPAQWLLHTARNFMTVKTCVTVFAFRFHK